jgi:hypothetical protein
MHIREVLWVPMIHTHEADIIRIFSLRFDREKISTTSTEESVEGEGRYCSGTLKDTIIISARSSEMLGISRNQVFY